MVAMAEDNVAEAGALGRRWQFIFWSVLVGRVGAEGWAWKGLGGTYHRR